MKRLLILLSILGLSMSSINTLQAADIPDEQWIKTGPAEQGGSWGINTADGFESPAAYLTSTKADNYDPNIGKTISVKTCTSFEPSECPRNEYQYFETPLSFCSGVEDFDCVKDIFISKEDGTKLKFNFLRNFPESNKYSFSGDRAARLPDSGYSILLEVPDAPHAGGNQYIVSAVLAGHRFPEDKEFTVQRMYVDIKAVTIVPAKLEPPRPLLDVSIGSSFMSVNRGGDSTCSIQCSTTENAIGQTFPSGIKFGVHLRLNAKVTGWLNGRVSRVDSSISIDSEGIQNIKVSGFPVRVPVVFGWITKSGAPESLKSYYGKMTVNEVNRGNGYGKCLDPLLPSGSQNGPCNSIYWESVLRYPQKNLTDMQELALWLPVVKDSAAVAPTYWNINSTDSNLYRECAADSNQLLGIVTTNASSFVSGPPTFNKEEGYLDYKVLAPHLLKDGTVFKGSYDLAINSKFARCIYGFSSAPISASVSVLSVNGENQVATVVTKERDGWIYLGAYGFTFSSPTVRVKLSQGEIPVQNVVKKTTITCVKGKTKKKVTAVKPKCPAGYKKAA